jgi:hypothetical protein
VRGIVSSLLHGLLLASFLCIYRSLDCVVALQVGNSWIFNFKRAYCFCAKISKNDIYQNLAIISTIIELLSSAKSKHFMMDNIALYNFIRWYFPVFDYESALSSQSAKFINALFMVYFSFSMNCTSNYKESIHELFWCEIG